VLGQEVVLQLRVDSRRSAEKVPQAGIQLPNSVNRASRIPSPPTSTLPPSSLSSSSLIPPLLLFRPPVLPSSQMADFCLDPQGWGPVSAIRYAFTPCFQDGILAAIPPIFIILFGSTQIWHFSQSARVPQSRNWIYWIKFSLVLILLGLNVLLTVIRWKESAHWQRDVFYWSALLKVFATGLALSLHHLEHVRNSLPVPSGVLLFYWLETLVVDGIKLYSLIDDKAFEQDLIYFITFSLTLGGEVLIFFLEYLVPKGTRDYYLLQQRDGYDDGAEPCPADYADIFAK